MPRKATPPPPPAPEGKNVSPYTLALIGCIVLFVISRATEGFFGWMYLILSIIMGLGFLSQFFNFFGGGSDGSGGSFD